MPLGVQGLDQPERNKTCASVTLVRQPWHRLRNPHGRLTTGLVCETVSPGGRYSGDSMGRLHSYANVRFGGPKVGNPSAIPRKSQALCHL